MQLKMRMNGTARRRMLWMKRLRRAMRMVMEKLILRLPKVRFNIVISFVW